MKKRICFTVEGRGQFPADMLRYDACWPYREAGDSSGITMSAELNGEAYFAKRQVTLITDNQHAPTVGRWQSFGWRVISQEVVR